MTKHIILWQLKDELSEEQKQTAMQNAKQALESLRGKIDGLIDIEVIIEKHDTSNVDMMLDSSFVSKEALADYAVHPLHVAAADNFVRPFTKLRTCIDYEA